MYTNHPTGSSYAAHTSHGTRGYGHQQNAGDAAGAIWTPEQCLAAYQTSNDQYWVDHGLTMNHSGLPSYPSQSSTPSASQTRRATSGDHGSLPTGGWSQPFRILPQEDYLARRRYQRQAPILFRASPVVGYVRLSDFYNPPVHSNPPLLEGGDDTVFSGDNLSQKQSIRLEIQGCKSYERQINVRNPANNARSITRRKLAEKIAKEIYDFMRRHQQTTFGDPSLGLGPGADDFNKIVLIELRHVSRSSWQPILGVLP
ncbi:hypothetical protein BD309DRAFT_389448 [Dichomitus squalens]|nr:hypothetical protein BD309DRAFT_389448 [Dichomitus squalens]